MRLLRTAAVLFALVVVFGALGANIWVVGIGVIRDGAVPAAIVLPVNVLVSLACLGVAAAALRLAWTWD